MYITQEIAGRIKAQAKEKGIIIKDLLSACEMNVNAISEFSKGKQLSCISLARIADYLDCSVDYLLGRENAPVADQEIDHEEDTQISQLLRNFEALNEEGRERLVETSDDLVSSGKYIKSGSFELGNAKMA